MDESDTTQAQIDLVSPLYNLVQAQFQMLGAMMEAQTRLMKGVERSVAKNTERLDTVILKFEELLQLRRGGIDGVPPSSVHPSVTDTAEPNPSVEQQVVNEEALTAQQQKETTEELTPAAPAVEKEETKKTTEELTPPAPAVEEEETKKNTEELTPPAPAVEKEEPKMTTEELTPPSDIAEKQEPKTTTEELTPPAHIAEEQEPKNKTEELTPLAPVAEEQQPTNIPEELTPPAPIAELKQPKNSTEELTPPASYAEEEQPPKPPVAEESAASPVQRYDPNELLLVRGSSHLPPVNDKDKETFVKLGIDKSQQSAAPPAIQDEKPPAVPVQDDWEALPGAPSEQLPQRQDIRQDDYSQHQQTWNNGVRSQRGTGPRGGGGPRGGFGGGRGGASPSSRAFPPAINTPPPSNNNGTGQQGFGDYASGAPGGNFAKGGDNFTANGHAGGRDFSRGRGPSGAAPRGGAPSYRGGGFGGTPRGGGPGGFSNAAQQRGNDASQDFGVPPGVDQPQFGGGGFDGNENKLPNVGPTTNVPPAQTNVNNGYHGGDGGFNNAAPQQQAAPRDNGFQPPQPQQARPFGAAQQPRGGGNFYNAASCRGGRGAFPRR